MQTQEEFNAIMDGMEDVNREMSAKIEQEAPMCHFKKMFIDRSDSTDGYYDEWWECSVCGHTQDI